MPNSKTLINRFDKLALSIAPTWAMKRIAAREYIKNLSAYRSASTGRLRSNWATTKYSSDALPRERQILQQRSNDATRNDPVASGALDTIRQNVVGSGLKPQSMLRAKQLGISEDRAKEIKSQIEHAFEIFSPMADAANILTFDEIQLLALSKIIEDGETIAIPAWANEPWRKFGRCIEVINANRLDIPKSTNGMRNGIIFGDRGQPLKYHVRKIDQKTGKISSDYNTIDARDKQGRPKIIHAFRVNQPGQTRGLPLFAPVLTYFKDLSDFLEAEVVAARIAACLAVFITKNDPIGMAVRTGTPDKTTGQRITSIEPGMIGHLQPNESIEVVDPKRPSENLPAYVEAMMRIIGVSFGMPYELIAKDFSKTNYSSARASLLEGRKVFTNWRKWFSAKFCQPFFDLVIEEAYLRNMIDISDFYENKNEYLRAKWIGGSWGWVDPVKEIKASMDAVQYGFSTYSDEIGGLGNDWEEVFDQRKRENDYLEDIGLTLPNNQDKNQDSKGVDDNAEQDTNEKEE